MTPPSTVQANTNKIGRSNSTNNMTYTTRDHTASLAHMDHNSPSNTLYNTGLPKTTTWTIGPDG
eukprot:14862623-Ditylum_brightwellii.AAC.1